MAANTTRLPLFRFESIRRAALLAALASPLMLFAQGQSVFHLQSAESLDRLQMKQAEETVKALDPEGIASFDGNQLKVRLAASVGGETLLRSLNAGTARFSILGGAPGRHALSGMPVLLSTGDPEDDQQRYDEAKRAWILAHPEQYQHALGNGPPALKPVDQ